MAAALDSPDELRAALDAGADDVMRVPFEPEVLVARVAAGLRAARLRANEALLRAMVDNIPGALYRGACDRDWTMHWLSDEVESDHRLSRQRLHRQLGADVCQRHPSRGSRTRRAIGRAGALNARRPFNLEYRIMRPRW